MMWDYNTGWRNQTSWCISSCVFFLGQGTHSLIGFGILDNYFRENARRGAAEGCYCRAPCFAIQRTPVSDFLIYLVGSHQHRGPRG